MEKPEEAARKEIDKKLEAAGWQVQRRRQVNIHAARGVAVCEVSLQRGHGYADYLLYLNGKAVGAVGGKKTVETLTGVEVQTEKYSLGVPSDVPAHLRPLPFLYQSTGVESRFTNMLDPEPRSRRLFHFHQPETLLNWLEATPHTLTRGGRTISLPTTLRSRLQKLPALSAEGLWPAQTKAIANLERSLRSDHPRSLIQMATGSGKTFTAVTSAYRLTKHADARRILFLVDRANLGRQALKEFQYYTPPDSNYKFTELYNVQHLSSNRVDSVSRVVIATIQRLYSMLQGKDLDPTLEEGSQYDTGGGLIQEPVPVVYHPALLQVGATWTNNKGETQSLKPEEDILIVAPYNAQVALLKRRLPNVKVGTVDKFQGQEAPIVFYSMTTSTPED